MRVFILTDVEGIPDIFTMDEIDRAKSEYALVREKLTAWTIRTAELCRENGADEVSFLDGHAGGGNILDEKLPKWLHKRDLNGWSAMLKDGEIDCQIELGAHARAGTIGVFLDHTLNSREIFCYKINGREMSELSLHAALCGSFNVPVVGCIGDRAACEQAKTYIPEIVTGVVKTANERNVCAPAENPDAVIAQTVREALANYKNIAPMKIALPAELSVTYYRTDFCERVLHRCAETVTRADARTVTRTLTEIRHYNDFRF